VWAEGGGTGDQRRKKVKLAKWVKIAPSHNHTQSIKQTHTCGDFEFVIQLKIQFTIALVFGNQLLLKTDENVSIYIRISYTCQSVVNVVFFTGISVTFDSCFIISNYNRRLVMIKDEISSNVGIDSFAPLLHFYALGISTDNHLQ